VVKPTIENGFSYKKLHWADLPLPPLEDVAEISPAESDAVTLAPKSARRRARRRKQVAATA
jgi:hypothetical protein